MRTNPLDDRTVNRLLAGTLPPEEAPPGYARVAGLLSAARPEPAAGELAEETYMVAAMQSAISHQPTAVSSPSRRSVLKKILTAKAAAVGGVLLLTTTGAAAATGSLPGAAQQIASDALSKVGISVPGPNSHAGAHPDSRGKSAGHTKSTTKHDKSTTGDDSTTHGTGPNAHAQFGQCTAQAASAGHPNDNSPVVSADCTNVTHPGNGSNADTGESNTNKPADPGSQGKGHTETHGATENDHGKTTATTANDAGSSGTGTSGDHGRP